MPDTKETTAGAAAEAGQSDDLSRFEAILAAALEKVVQKSAPIVSELADLAPAAATVKASLLSRLTPRMLACLVLAVCLAAGVAVLSPAQLPVAAYKLCLVCIAGYLGYWLDRWTFPYGRPDSYLAAADWRAEKGAAADAANHPVAPGCEQIYAAAMLRRALIMLGAMLAMGLGL